MKTKRKSEGFTLIELLVALALSALLLVAVLLVSSSMTRVRTALDQKAATTDPWPSAAIEMLRWDLSNATRMTAEQNRLSLEGFGSLHSVTMVPTHRPVQVEYVIKTVNQEPWLVRRQRSLDSNSNRNEVLELVCRDVGEFVLMDASTAKKSTQPPPTLFKTTQAMPRIVSLRMSSSGAAPRTVEKMLVIN